MAEQINWSIEQDEILIDFVRTHEALYNVKSAEYRKMRLKQSLWHEIGTILRKTDADCSKLWAYIRDYYIRKQGKPGTGSIGEAAKKRSELLSFLDSCPSVKRSTVSNIQHVEEASQGLQEDSQIDKQNTPQTESQTNAVDEQSLPLQGDDDNLSRDVYSPEFSSEISNTPTTSIASTTTELATIRPAKKRKASSTSEARLQLLQEIANRQPQVQEAQDETDLFFASTAKIVKKLPPQEQVRLRLEINTMIGNVELTFYNQTNTNTVEIGTNTNTYFTSSEPSTSENSTDYDFLYTLQRLK